ncbi:MAG: hypothetical protein J0G32_04020 [Alphaproteobacteria bacterium]|nr:hypothetical protein [Alphaproteobacteria bacterium]
MTRCPGAKEAGQCNNNDNIIKFYEEPSNIKNKKWKENARTQMESGNKPLLYTGQSIQLNGDIFWKKNDDSYGFVIGFLPVAYKDGSKSKITFKCIRKLGSKNLYNNQDPYLPNTHKDLRFRAPSEAGEYYMFVTNAINASSTRFQNTSDIVKNTNKSYSLQEICDNQRSEGVEVALDDIDLEGYETSINRLTNTFKLVNRSGSTYSYNKSKVFEERIIKVINDQCDTDIASNVKWPKTDVGVTITAANTMCDPNGGNGNREVVGTTYRQCIKDQITGRSQGWSPVSGPGCLQRCGSNKNRGFDGSKTMYLPSLYEDETLTVHAGSAGKAFGQIPVTTYTTTDLGRNIGSFTPCYSENHVLMSNKSVKIKCEYNPNNYIGEYSFDSDGVCVDLRNTNLNVYSELRDNNKYHSLNDKMENTFGRFGQFEAVYSGYNPLSQPSSDMLPNDGDRVLTLIDQSWGGKHIDLSNVRAIYRSSKGGGLEITGEARYYPEFSNAMGGRFALMGMVSLVNHNDSNANNMIAINAHEARAFITAKKFGNAWTPVFMYNGSARWGWGNDPDFAFSFRAIDRPGVKLLHYNRPTYVSMADTTLDQISYNIDWENDARDRNICKRFSDCKWGDGWTKSTNNDNTYSPCAQVNVFKDTMDSCQNYFTGTRYGPIYFEKSPVKFMISGDDGEYTGNDWKMYFHPQSNSRLLNHRRGDPPETNGLGKYNEYRWKSNSPSILIGSDQITFILHEMNIIQWDVYDGKDGGRVINSRSSAPFNNSYGWRGNEALTGIVAGRSATNNFFLDRQRSLETYYQYNVRNGWARLHGVTDRCPGYHHVFSNDLWPDYFYWDDPCRYGVDQMNWGRK